MSTQVLEQTGKYTSFSGCDMVASITLPSEIYAKPIVIGNLQTVSYSIKRETSPVYRLGEVNPIGMTRGVRLIAGSLIFTMFDKNLVYTLQEVILKELKKRIDNNENIDLEVFQKNQFANFVIGSLSNQRVVMDMMPPFDIEITSKNEYGKSSSIKIQGIYICDEGQVASIEDILTENTMSYKATDIKPLNKC